MLPCGSIITKILQHFDIPLRDSVYEKTKRIDEEAIIGIGFYRMNKKWVNTTTSKNWDTLIALEDDRELNDVYPVDQLPDVLLGAGPLVPRRGVVAQPQAKFDSEE